MTRPARVVLIAGPPCAGKTTLAHQLSQPGDLIVDFDDTARELGSPAQWLHPEPYRSQAEAQLRTTLAQLPGPDAGTAYVIRSASTARARAIQARAIQARECILIVPTRDECHRRADTDQRPAGTHQQIDHWYDTHTPWTGDAHHGEPPAASIFGR